MSDLFAGPFSVIPLPHPSTPTCINRNTTVGDLRNATVASVSFGAARVFAVRSKDTVTSSAIELTLADGSLAIMAGAFQQLWQHSLPPNQTTGVRINLTFRRIQNPERTPVKEHWDI